MASREPLPPRNRSWAAVALVSLVGLLAAVGLAGCGGDTSTRSTSDTATSNELSGIARDDPLDVSAVVLPEVAVDAPDRPFTMKADPGRLLFVYFGYTNCPDLCPTTMSDLRKALAQLPADEASRVQVAFVTVDPQRDTADHMNPFLASFVTGGHSLRTTDPALLQQAEDAFLASSTVTTAADGTVEVSHTAVSYLVDAQGHVVDEMPFGTTPDDMADDLRLLLARQSTT